MGRDDQKAGAGDGLFKPFLLRRQWRSLLNVRARVGRRPGQTGDSQTMVERRDAMIRTYKIHYRVFWKLADDLEPFERETTEQAYSAEDALTQLGIRLSHQFAYGRLQQVNDSRPYGITKPYEITKIEPMEAKR
jgi:hypothetical protein